jgi:TetR/AcrR family transcriptional regulator, transcriptional repressor for nem operon
MGRLSTKPQILDAAVGLFHRQGYNGSGVQDIVAEAGVPKGSFYNHFASKEALGIAALQRYWEGGATLLEMLRDDAQRPADRLRAYFQALADITRRADHRFGCMIGNLGSELGGTTPSIRVEIAAIMASWSGAIADCIRDGQRDGSIRGDMEPEELGLFLLDAWEGALLRAKVDRSEAPIAAFMTIALGGLLQTS